MASVWFLVVTLCTVNPGALATDCNDYIEESGVSYPDCLKAMAKYQTNSATFGMACLRGEPLDGEK